MEFLAYCSALILHSNATNDTITCTNCLNTQMWAYGKPRNPESGNGTGIRNPESGSGTGTGTGTGTGIRNK